VRVTQDPLVDRRLDGLEAVAGDLLEVREVEAQAARLDEGAGLLGVLAELLLDRRVQDVRGGVAAGGRDPPAGVDAGLDRLALADLAGDDAGTVDGQPLDPLLGVEHLEAAGRGLEQAGVADLAATLGVERRAGQHDLDEVALLGGLLQATGGDDRAELGLRDERVVADELGGADRTGRLPVDVHRHAVAALLGRGAGPLALLLHQRVEPVTVELEAGVRRDLHGQVDREAVGVVQLEGRVAREAVERVVGPDPADRLVELVEALAQAVAEVGLLGARDAGDELALGREVRVGIGHPVDHRLHHRHEQGLAAADLHAEQLGVADRAAHQAAQHVAAALLGGQDAVADQERGGAGVLGDDPQRDVVLLVVAVAGAR
jgi:hypothetical protein